MTRYPLLALLTLAAPMLLIGLGWAPLLDWDENIYGETARQIVERGSVIVLYLNGHIFWEKPPLFLWEMAGLFHLFGVGPGVARLTSGLNALLILAGMYLVGRRLGGALFGWLWALLYLSSLLPLVLSRSAVIDHTFNGLIAASLALLIFYDRAHAAFRVGQARRGRHWAWLLGAAVAMGAGVLTKGPLGGAVPLVAFAAYKLERPRPWPHPMHVLACGVVSLSIALSWYAANYVLAGPEFIAGFTRFQGLLFSKPLEGHGGPWFYHFGIAVLGLFPWTPLLLLWARRAPRRRLWADAAWRPLIAGCLGWAGFVLAVFSLVQTKLPHYSSVIYIPLTFLTALILTDLLREGGRVPRWLGVLFAAYAVVLGALLAGLPYAMNRVAEANGVLLHDPPAPAALAWLPGALLVLGVCWAAWHLVCGRIQRGVLIGTLAMGLCMLGLWRMPLPQFAAYNQGALIDMMDEAYGEGGELLLYRMVSFAVLFRGQRDVEMLHTYKFPGDPTRLDRPADHPLYVVSAQSQAARLLHEHPLLQPVRRNGDLSLFRLPPRAAQ
ncbi:MAG: glycosyltransferase family 39 protein [Candidatus Lambdaproteobacteria bacterium]|nr:glycosyltransferase family 39 protein [Candidatus Lambdaproteobacteria bacterium]